MTGWILLIASCAVSGALGFSAVRFRSATLREPVVPARAPRAAARPAARQRTTVPRPTVPGPTAPQPDERLLALWASQVEAGTRKMSVATDGCRVTWSRACKHGHPSWLVYLHYVSPD